MYKAAYLSSEPAQRLAEAKRQSTILQGEVVDCSYFESCDGSQMLVMHKNNTLSA